VAESLSNPQTPGLRDRRELGRAMYALTITMMQDVGGWARLYRIKTLEAGG
jgi:hypothetical protein